MASLLDEVHLPERAVLSLGVVLVALGLLIPFAGAVYYLAMWESTEEEVERIGPLRPEMVILPAGSFLMGSPADEPDRFSDETLHEVTITERFAISRTEITQGQYLAVMDERPAEERQQKFLGSDQGGCSEAGVGNDLPVICVDWLDAIRFCNKLSEMEGLEPVYATDGSDVTWDIDANGYRLPTEAEWEYAARANTRDRYAGTDDPSELCAYANVAVGSFCEDPFVGLAPVGSMRPSRWHLFDMSGNAWEWVWDRYGPYSEEDSVERREAERSSNRVYRGGSWRSTPGFARVVHRNRVEPSSRYDALGFRVARSLPSTL